MVSARPRLPLAATVFFHRIHHQRYHGQDAHGAVGGAAVSAARLFNVTRQLFVALGRAGQHRQHARCAVARQLSAAGPGQFQVETGHRAGCRGSRCGHVAAYLRAGVGGAGSAWWGLQARQVAGIRRGWRGQWRAGRQSCLGRAQGGRRCLDAPLNRHFGGHFWRWDRERRFHRRLLHQCCCGQCRRKRHGHRRGCWRGCWRCPRAWQRHGRCCRHGQGHRHQDWRLGRHQRAAVRGQAGQWGRRRRAGIGLLHGAPQPGGPWRTVRQGLGLAHRAAPSRRSAGPCHGVGGCRRRQHLADAFRQGAAQRDVDGAKNALAQRRRAARGVAQPQDQPQMHQKCQHQAALQAGQRGLGPRHQAGRQGLVLQNGVHGAATMSAAGPAVNRSHALGVPLWAKPIAGNRLVTLARPAQV